MKVPQVLRRCDYLGEGNKLRLKKKRKQKKTKQKELNHEILYFTRIYALAGEYIKMVLYKDS